MNDPNKAIQVNLSSLLSLKAELLRKQAEVNKAKAAQSRTDEYVANRAQYSSSSVSSSSSSKHDKKERTKEVKKCADATVYEHEDSELLEKSKRVLEAKSKFYECMSRSGGKLNSDDNCLVLFNRKQQEQRIDDSSEEVADASVSNNQDSESELSSSGDDHDLEEISSDPNEDWVEYIDCLGRTRKCLHKDLEKMKQQDAELAASMPERLDQTKANWMINTKGDRDCDDTDSDLPIGPMPTESIYGDGCSLMSKHDEQRANWERKEQENLDKIDVHYQDVFFDEARQHGVGYYAFSTDEEERKKQQRELEESRQRTMEEQKHRDELRAQREKIIAERVRSAKNRQRARLGLPPLEENEEEKQKLEQQHETKEERKGRKRADKLKRKQEKIELEREEERQRHIRPWDKQKEGVAQNVNNNDADAPEPEPKWAYKPERLPMSQEEWNDKKRAERISEFAPVCEPWTSSYIPKRTNFTSVPPPMPVPPPTTPRIYDMAPPTSAPPAYKTFLPSDTFASFQTTKHNKKFQRRNYESETQHNTTAEQEQEDRRQGAAIPPPDDLDANQAYPSRAKKPKSTNELERSIEAGLRFLRDNCDKGNMTTKSSWTAKADY